MENKQLKFLDLFAGIGGFRFGMESAGHKCVGFAEIDKFARESYKAIHNTEGEIEYHDVTAVTNEQWSELKGEVDVICGGFPCQSFSVAGKRRGFLDETRGTLFFEIARAAEQIKPRTLFLENVKGLLSHGGGETFRTILATLDELGYDAEWEVFNSKNFGVPQNRERVFIIGHLRGERGREVFPFGRKNGKPNEERQIKIVGSTKGAHQTSLGQREVVYDAKGLVGALTATDYKQPKIVGIPIKQIGNIDQANRKRKNPQTGRVYDPTGISPSLSTMQGGGLEPKIIQKSRGFNKGGEHDIAPALSSNSWEQNNLLKESVFNGMRIRKLTPRECWRLQGFLDLAFDKAQEVNSNSQLYKQAGNSVTVNVISEIAKRL